MTKTTNTAISIAFILSLVLMTVHFSADSGNYTYGLISGLSVPLHSVLFVSLCMISGFWAANTVGKAYVLVPAYLALAVIVGGSSVLTSGYAVIGAAIISALAFAVVAKISALNRHKWQISIVSLASFITSAGLSETCPVGSCGGGFLLGMAVISILLVLAGLAIGFLCAGYTKSIGNFLEDFFADKNSAL